MTETSAPLILTIGHGKRSISEVIDLLKRYDVAFVVDVRSVPWSRFQPDFSQDALGRHLKQHGLAYLSMGEQLGGRPKDALSGDDAERIDYQTLQQRPAFRQGIERLKTAWAQGRRVALLCSESRPQECHRSKLIGTALAGEGIEVTHVDENNALVNQQDVMARLAKGQLSLLDEVPPAEATRSRRKYRSAEP
jgi:uncharacterized protein (DUF488 family)